MTTKFSSEATFHLKRQLLVSRLLSTVREFSGDHGLQDLDEAALRQMAVKLDDVAGELLMFGCDHWPESARGEDKAAA
ncbi:hypothetical protein [Bradyrhizobium sp. Gha]|uniref:hypothetical protein n=1 Tax=Bradyrhizobium sp. Gha TaxID=1855318 RepID=UPI0008EA9124|nr:hypothetical protein [Bradyrhizobium sp. Gha]SFJ24537.1 hypothetical protein SAMN05216525_1218 [Bradyrhizobium sp. Gha]